MKIVLLLLALGAVCYGQSLELYTDANPDLALSWQANGTLSEDATDRFEGARSLKFAFAMTDWWSGYRLVPTGGAIDLRGYENLVIAAKVSNPGYLMNVSVKLIWANTGSNEVRAGKIYAWDFWKSHTIPLSTWSNDSVMNNIVGIQIDLLGPGSNGTLWIDDIRATGAVTPPVELDGPPRILRGQYGTTQWGDYLYCNTVWGPVDALWTQRITANCDTNQSWRVEWNFSANQGVQSYPCCSMNDVSKPEMVYRLSSRRATFATWEIDSVESAGSGINAAFDIFTCATPWAGASTTELMIWYQHLGNYPMQDMLPKVKQAAAGLPVAGRTWDVYHARFGTDSLGNGGWNYIAFVCTENVTDIGTFDINFFFDYAVSIGRADPDDYVTSISAGPEICGGQGKLVASKFTVTWDGTTTPVSVRAPTLAVARNPKGLPRAIVVAGGSSPSRVHLGSASTVFDIKGRAVSLTPKGRIGAGVLLIR